MSREFMGSVGIRPTLVKNGGYSILILGKFGGVSAALASVSRTGNEHSLWITMCAKFTGKSWDVVLPVMCAQYIVVLR